MALLTSSRGRFAFSIRCCGEKVSFGGYLVHARISADYKYLLQNRGGMTEVVSLSLDEYLFGCDHLILLASVSEHLNETKVGNEGLSMYAQSFNQANYLSMSFAFFAVYVKHSILVQFMWCFF